MALRLARRPSLTQWATAWAAATAVALGASWLISRRHEQNTASAGEVSEVDTLAGGPQPIYPDQATGGYPETESGMPDEGPAGPNARPDWTGRG